MPRILYKYLNIKGAEAMIGNKTLQFTNATKLNDPFDCHQKLIDYSRVSSPKGWIPNEWWEKKDLINAENLRNETWLCSLSKVNDSVVMWSHYCYDHKGVCIGLDIDKVIANTPPLFSMIYVEPLVLDVQYRDILERPKTDSSKEIFSYQWQTKAKEWEYEQEVRLVVPKPTTKYAAFTPEQAKEAEEKEMWDIREIHVYMPLRGECFDSIYFGINIDPAEKEKIINYARTKLNPQIKLYQMGVDENALRLKPQIIEWDGPKKDEHDKRIETHCKKTISKM